MRFAWRWAQRLVAWGDEEKTRCVYKRGTGVFAKEAEINVYEGTIGVVDGSACTVPRRYEEGDELARATGRGR